MEGHDGADAVPEGEPVGQSPRGQNLDAEQVGAEAELTVFLDPRDEPTPDTEVHSVLCPVSGEDLEVAGEPALVAGVSSEDATDSEEGASCDAPPAGPPPGGAEVDGRRGGDGEPIASEVEGVVVAAAELELDGWLCEGGAPGQEDEEPRGAEGVTGW